MDGSSHSFQEIMKLMNSMTAFETLLDAANLKPDDCVALGIHEQFDQLLGKVGKCVKHENATVENLKCVCNLCNEEIKLLSFDVRTSLAIHNAGEVHRIIVKNKELNQRDEGNRPSIKEHTAAHSVGLNNITPGQKNSGDNDFVFIEKDKIVNNLNNASPVCSKCQQPYCVGLCVLKQNNLFGLQEKLAGLNIQNPFGPRAFSPPVAQAPPTTARQHAPRGRSPQSRPNKKPQDDKRRSKSQVADPAQTQQSINIHVHMPSASGQSAAAAARPAAQPQGANRKATASDLDLLQSKQLGVKEETQMVFKMIRQAEGKHWRRENVTKKGNEYMCNICNTGSRIKSGFDVVMHIRGKFHQDNLKSTHPAQNNVQNKTQNKNTNYNTPTERSAQRQNVPPNSHKFSSVLDNNLELLRNRSLDERAERSLMWRMVKESEGERWAREHVTPSGDEFVCNICGVNLNSPHQVVQHVQGASHCLKLNSAEPCAVM